MRRFRTVAVLGVGLIGGSFAMALRRAGGVTRIIGADRDREALERAAAMGVIDTAEESVAEAVKEAELIVVAVPVRAMGPVLHAVARAMPPQAVVTDAGSTKAEVVRAAEEAMGERIARFVPGHPIAGRETSGVESAIPDLFRGARVVLAPTATTAPDALEAVRLCWEACGARVTQLSPERHDQVFAAVSHLPHLLAFALVSEILSRPDGAELFGFAGGGFRDFTRIAASSPEMWRDIALANRSALLEEIDRYAARLAVFRELVDKGDGPGLQRLMTEARNARRGLGAGKPRSTSPE
jgi:prephenate dehydrogenase